MPSSKINFKNSKFVLSEFSNFKVSNITEIENNLILILGNTIANEINIQSYLTKLRTTIKGRTYLLIGIELINTGFKKEIKSIINEYNCDENKKLTISPINWLGINFKCGKIKIIFNNKLSRIEEMYVFDKSTTININNKKMWFNKGDYLLLSITNKPNLFSFSEIIKKSGWTIVKKRNIDNQHMFLLKK